MWSLQWHAFASLVVSSCVVNATPLIPRASSKDLESCPGYAATNVQTTNTGLTADLSLAGEACNVYGTDLDDLTLTVEYQNSE